jgi:radical SAM-linked protein
MAMRIRITFSKAGAMQYVGLLDLQRAWERVFRRSGLALEYSHGFHPQPHLNLACALPVGFTSQCELLDAWLEQAYPLPTVQRALTTVLAPGLEIQALENVDPHSPALQTLVRSAVYEITFLDDLSDLGERLERVNSADHLPRTRRNKPYDLRPLVEATCLLPSDDEGRSRLQLQLAARDASTGRPEEFLDELGINFEDTQVHRIALILIGDES